MKRILGYALLAITLLTGGGLGVLYAQDPAMFFQRVEIHRGFLLLGASVPLKFDGTTAGTVTTTLNVVDPTTTDKTVLLPNVSGGLPVLLYCGSTGTGDQTCTVATAASSKIYAGHSTLSSNSAVITFPTAFASTTYDCVANDVTTRANVVQMVSTSASTATITNTTGASDVINWVCSGQ